MSQIEERAATDKAAASFWRNYGPTGWLATVDEWQRSFLAGCPTSSIIIERVHREVKRVSNVPKDDFTNTVLSYAFQNWPANISLPSAIDRMKDIFAQYERRRHEAANRIGGFRPSAQQAAFSRSHQSSASATDLEVKFKLDPCCQPRSCQVRCRHCPESWPCLHMMVCDRCIEYGLYNSCPHVHFYPTDEVPVPNIPDAVKDLINPQFPSFTRIRRRKRSRKVRKRQACAAAAAASPQAEKTRPLTREASGESSDTTGETTDTADETEDGLQGSEEDLAVLRNLAAGAWPPMPPVSEPLPSTSGQNPVSKRSVATQATDCRADLLAAELRDCKRALDDDFRQATADEQNDNGGVDAEAAAKQSRWQRELATAVEELQKAMASKKFTLTSDNSCRTMTSVVRKMTESVKRGDNFADMGVVAPQVGYIPLKKASHPAPSGAKITANPPKRRSTIQFIDALPGGPVRCAISDAMKAPVSSPAWALLASLSNATVAAAASHLSGDEKTDLLSKVADARAIWHCVSGCANTVELASTKFLTCSVCRQKWHAKCAGVILSKGKDRIERIPTQWQCQNCS